MNRFYKSEGKIFSFNAEHLEDKLNPGIYDLKQGQGTFYLKERDSLKSFDMYGDTGFYDRIIKEFKVRTNNLGAYFNGIAGAGKTVACNYICNNLNLPIICINESFKGEFVQYLSELSQKCIVYIDEADKVFKYTDNEKDSTDQLLTLLDGKYKTNMLFLMTSNEMIENKYLYNRLGRLKYYKEFNGVKIDTAIEVIDKKLKHTIHKDALIKLFETINPLTFDTIESMIEDINIHDEPAIEAASHFCLVRETNKDSYISFNLFIDGKMFATNRTDTALDYGYFTLRGSKYRDPITDYLKKEHNTKLGLSDLEIDNIKPLPGDHEYEYVGELLALDKKVYLNVVPNDNNNNKLYRHFSE